MTERFKLSLSGMWLLVSLFALIFPIFVPSFPGATGLANPIGTATVTMFVLSFPSSLFGIPLLFMTDLALGLDPNSIKGMYVNLLILFVLGLVQWFWIVPRVLRSESTGQALDLLPTLITGALPERTIDMSAEFFDVKETTPLERVLRDED